MAHVELNRRKINWSTVGEGDTLTVQPRGLRTRPFKIVVESINESTAGTGAAFVWGTFLTLAGRPSRTMVRDEMGRRRPRKVEYVMQYDVTKIDRAPTPTTTT